MDFKRLESVPIRNVENTQTQPPDEAPSTPPESGFTAADRFESYNINFLDSAVRAGQEYAIDPNAPKAYPNTTEGTVQLLLDAAVRQSDKGQIQPDTNAMLDRLSQLSPDEFKAVMQELIDKGEFSKIVGLLGSDRFGQVLGKLLSSAQNDPELLQMIEKCIDAAGAGNIEQGLVSAAGGDPQLLKILPERQLLKMLIAAEGSPAWDELYQAIQAKGPSAAAQKVLIDETVEYLASKTNAVFAGNAPWMRDVTNTLLSLSPQDYKEVVGKLMDAGNFLPLLENLASLGPTAGQPEVGKILGDLLQRAQTDPQLASVLEQCLNDPAIVDNCAAQFVNNATPQAMSILSESTLMALMDRLEGKPQWDKVFEALSIKTSS